MGKYFDTIIFGHRLLEVMEDNNDTRESLGDYLSLSKGTISRYTCGLITPKVPTVRAIAEKYNVNPAWLMGAVGAGKYLDSLTRCKQVPVIGAIAAGKPILANATFDECETIPEGMNVDFVLRVKGDSMTGARILDGVLVFVRKQPDVENGEIAVVMVDDEATLKRVYKLDSSIILRAENPNYKDMVFSKKEMKDIKIIGKVVSFKSEAK